MKGDHLGELEELVLLSVGALAENAYAVTILKQISEKSDRAPDVTALHSVLRRHEKKGFVTSGMGGVSHTRGGRRKRYFKLTPEGRELLDKSMLVRLELYKKLLSVEVKN
jgi:DNA-binding PadR family transcriptional regulator